MDTELLLLVGFGVFTLVCGLTFYTKYNRHEQQKIELQNMVLQTQEIQQLAEQVEYYKRSAQNYQQRIKRITAGYDVDLEEADIDPELPQDQLIPQVVSAAADKLPPSLKPILGNPEIVKAGAGIIAKNPDLLPKILELFGVGKTGSSSTPPPGTARFAV